MVTVRKWTGWEADLLREAKKMSIRGFAGYLGVSESVVMQWKQRGATLIPVAESQQILDTALGRCSDAERAAFSELISATGPPGETAAGDGHPAGRIPDLPSGLVVRQMPTEVAASQDRWRAARRYLNGHREQLSRAAAGLYDPALRVAGTPLLTTPGWMPAEPVPIDRIRLVWTDDDADVLVSGSEPEAQATHPLRAPGLRFDRYTMAIRYIDSPTLFENRPSYRLSRVQWKGDEGELTFGLGTYFDKLDVCEAIGHEFAAVSLERPAELASPAPRLWGHLPLRRLVADPFDPTLRAVTPAITTLLIRRRRDGTATFLLHWRDPAKVATAGGLYDTIPAGEFQPGSIMSAKSPEDFDLWRNIVRELNEELLGAPEFDGSRSRPLAYEKWPLFRALEGARREGRLKVFCFGIGIDALTLAATIPSALVIDDEVFDQLFGEIAESNAEGVTVTHWDGQDTSEGIPFTHQNITRFISNEPMAPPGAACLALAWKHREILLAR
ncbi:helix-turn-helix domain-containing protein [Streptomyces sp. 7N604]|uniref:helix-turn-helix domain-containing protein n=1 Tax=Streptomyces sp. 7N604 TaxID=3457415 RepID=UPI003FD4D207